MKYFKVKIYSIYIMSYSFLLLSIFNLISLPNVLGFVLNTNDIPSTRYVCTHYSMYDTIDYYNPSQTKFNFPKTWNKVSSEGHCSFECSPCEKIKINGEVYNYGFSASCKISPIKIKKYGLYGVPDHYYQPISYSQYNLSSILSNNLITQEGIYIDYPNHEYISKYKFCLYKDNPFKVITENNNLHPSIRPSTKPNVDPTSKPTVDPTNKPNVDPTSKPNVDPTSKPNVDPPNKPNVDPPNKPNVDPTTKPTVDPTSKPTAKPNVDPTSKPTAKPNVDPTSKPTAKPNVDPTSKPTAKPNVDPTRKPTPKPSFEPTNKPSDDKLLVESDSNKTQIVPDFNYKYCMKSPDHLPGVVWANSVKMEFGSDYQNDDLTILEECAKLCKEYSYFGIDSGAVCKCGNNEPIKPNINSEGNCLPCYDNPQYTCGNVNYGFMSLYQIEK